MKKYLSAILVFDVLLPALLLGIPGCILLSALISFQQFAETKTAEFSAHQDRVRFVESLNRELQPVQAKVPLLKAGKVFAGRDRADAPRLSVWSLTDRPGSR